MGDPKDAFEPLKKALEIAPGHGLALSSLATAHVKAGNPDAVVTVFRDAVEQFPNRWDFHASLASALTTYGDFPAALEAHRKAARYTRALRVEPLRLVDRRGTDGL